MAKLLPNLNPFRITPSMLAYLAINHHMYSLSLYTYIYIHVNTYINNTTIVKLKFYEALHASLTICDAHS